MASLFATHTWVWNRKWVSSVDSIRENWGKPQTFESCSRITFPWINCQLGGVSLLFTASMGWKKMMWSKLIDFWVISYRDLVPCRKSEKWNYLEIQRIISKALRRSWFFMRDWQEFLFHYCSTNFSVSSCGEIFSGVDCLRVGNFVHGRDFPRVPDSTPDLNIHLVQSVDEYLFYRAILRRLSRASPI
jgi:hypothetical protein